MFEDVINDIQDSIGRLQHEIEAKREGTNANPSPEEQGTETGKTHDEMKGFLDKWYQAFKVLTERR